MELLPSSTRRWTCRDDGAGAGGAGAGAGGGDGVVAIVDTSLDVLRVVQALVVQVEVQVEVDWCGGRHHRHVVGRVEMVQVLVVQVEVMESLLSLSLSTCPT